MATFLKQQGTSSERGDIMPAIIAAIFLLLFAFCAVIDPACAGFQKSRQESTLMAAREACLQPAYALKQKNSETPGRNTAKQVVETMRSDGFAGKITIWYFEASQSLTGASKRLYVVGIQAEENFQTIVSHGIGVDTIPVGSHTVFSGIPYSEERAWRPTAIDAGSYTAEAESMTPTYQSIANIENYPAEMGDELNSQLQAIEKEEQS